ncbi:MAG: 4-hydroxythreonine-4-phosphate dehydrogenase PdxA [Spirochaetaceae bacterium]|nr:4-hydroxythreonine-4-phosphate dehydrogenase PdxA [Spirochaetaceae bacterium]
MQPVIAVTMGDPAGIGPEIVVKALAEPKVQKAAFCIICGSRSVLEQACRCCNISKQVLESDFATVYDVPNLELKDFIFGKVSAACGKAAFSYIEKACHLTSEGKTQAVVTAPINKESLKAASVPYIGHTEIFASLTSTDDPLTLFEVNNLRIFFLTRHVSLQKACQMITKERIKDYVIRCSSALTQLGIKNGTMAIAGLNPHSGEHGLFGTEELDAIEPAVSQLKSLGYDVAGPISADSVFHQALQGKYNSVLSLYHDQGHIAAKTYDFERTISITCGMPILRTSVDHGTAFDIAWQNKASAISMVEAILTAAKYAPHWNKASLS